MTRVWSHRPRYSYLCLFIGAYVLASIIGATVGSAILVWLGIQSQSLWTSWQIWWLGHATGVLIAAPLALGVIQKWRGEIKLSAARWAEASVLQEIIDAVPVRTWSATPAGDFYFNKRYQEHFRAVIPDFDAREKPSVESLLQELIHPDDAAGVRSALGNCFESGGGSALRFRWREGDGAYRWAECRVAPRRDDAGQIVQWYGASIDIDDEVRAQEALRERERELSQLVNMVPVQIRRLTPEGHPTFFNKRLLDFFGLQDVSGLDKPGMSRLTAGIKGLVHPNDSPGLLTTVHHSLATGEPWTKKYRMRRADGVYRWVDGRGEPVRDQSGTIVAWYAISLDIDDEMRAQQALRDREREFSQLVDMVPIQIARVGPDGEPTFFNKRALDFFGLDVEGSRKPGATLLSRTITTAAHPDDVAALEERVKQSLATGEPYVTKYRLRSAEGVYRWMEGRAVPVRREDGAIAQWYAVSIDIDDLMRAQETLRERERELRELVDVVPVAIGRLDTRGDPTFFNRRMIDFLGLDVLDLASQDTSRMANAIATSLHPDDAVGFTEALEHSLATGEPFSRRYRLRRADGVHRWVEGRIEPLRDQDGVIVQWYGVSLDVDDQVRLNRELADREARIRRLVDSDVIGIVFWDLNGTLLDANDAFLRIVQYDREDLKAGLDWFAMTPPEWQEVHAREEAAELAATGKMQAREKEYFRKDGSRVPILIGAACFEDNPRQGVAYILDLTERKRAERALWQLVETLPVMIDCAGPDGEPIYRSRQLRKFLGYELEELDGTGSSRLAGTLDAGVHPDDVAGVKEHYARSLATGEPYARRHRLRRFDGEYLWVDTRAAAMRDAEGAIVQWNVTCIDIDAEVRAQEELRLAQERLARASQAASLAELSASIAHEVNQPLAAVVANSHACQRWLSIEPPNIERAKITVDRIIRDANSAADVVSRVRALFRRASVPRSSEDVNRLIGEVCRLMADEISAKDIRIETTLEQNLPPLALDRVQVQQVIMNLVRNGIEAMSDVSAGARALKIRSIREGSDIIRIEVCDAGAGFADADRALEPFFTTKKDGMGMGLAICRSIVESHGGRLWTANNEQRGATVAFTLPLPMHSAP